MDKIRNERERYRYVTTTVGAITYFNFLDFPQQTPWTIRSPSLIISTYEKMKTQSDQISTIVRVKIQIRRSPRSTRVLFFLY